MPKLTRTKPLILVCFFFAIDAVAVFVVRAIFFLALPQLIKVNNNSFDCYNKHTQKSSSQRQEERSDKELYVMENYLANK